MAELSECDKGLDLPICLRCEGVKGRCSCHWAWTLPAGVSPQDMDPQERKRERALRQAREDREFAYLREQIAQGKLSPAVATKLGLRP